MSLRDNYYHCLNCPDEYQNHFSPSENECSHKRMTMLLFMYNLLRVDFSHVSRLLIIVVYLSLGFFLQSILTKGALCTTLDQVKGNNPGKFNTLKRT